MWGSFFFFTRDARNVDAEGGERERRTGEPSDCEPARAGANGSAECEADEWACHVAGRVGDIGQSVGHRVGAHSALVDQVSEESVADDILTRVARAVHHSRGEDGREPAAPRQQRQREARERKSERRQPRLAPKAPPPVGERCECHHEHHVREWLGRKHEGRPGWARAKRLRHVHAKHRVVQPACGVGGGDASGHDRDVTRPQ
mmetsp:Transcript_20265/g.60256  ORF Transcript_20265/g.60256 Transcript_20265/m.60256 type:complete len:203 (-) Transcript_20265:613-1221(-)